ncbi:MAG: carbohydrate ABC transporter substrate-binding protein [Sphaerochaetaceae bacterium]|nr:carbohydrate ABC transporter substrate-binding protein [Sphaerochaetaceae bacterium]
MKKILFTLACITIAASSLLMASGQKEATVDTSKSDELVVWLWDMGFNGATMQKAAEIYKEDHPEFNLVIEDQGDWNTLQTKLTTIASSGKLDSLPDILLIQDNAFQKNYMSFPEVFTDLSNTNIDYTQFASGKTGYSVIDGKNYGVPFDNGAVIFGYRTDILAKAGYTIDDFTDITWSQWLKQARVVLEKTGKPLLSAQAGSSDIINMMLQSAGASLFNTDGSPNIVNNDVLYKVAETYMQMLDDGTCIEATDWSGYTNSFSSGAVAGTMTGCWIAATIQGATDQAGKWKITNMPSLDGIPTATNYSNNGGSSWAVTSACKNVDLAADFFAMTFGSSMELYDAVAQNGVLGTYLPSANSSVYSQPNEFFSGQPIMSIITEFAGKVPAIEGGAYYYDARDAVCTAITQIQSGAVAKEAFQDAQDTVNFMMGN